MPYSPRLDEAIATATNDFRDITRKGSGAPYITHLMAVMALVGEYGGDEDQMIAAVLHDWIEDTEGTEEDLRNAYGDRVAKMVTALSDCDGTVPKPAWKVRKVTYLAELRNEPADVKLISAADKLHNVQSIIRDYRRVGFEVFDRFKGKKDGTLWYYAECLDALADGWNHPILAELEEAVTRMHRMADLGEAITNS